MDKEELSKRMIRFMAENKIKGLGVIYRNLNALLTISEDIIILLYYMKYDDAYPDKNKLTGLNKNISSIIDLLYDEKINSSFDNLKIDFIKLYDIKKILDKVADLFDTKLDPDNLQLLINYSYKSEDKINQFRDNTLIENNFTVGCTTDVNNYKTFINTCIEMVSNRKKELE